MQLIRVNGDANFEAGFFRIHTAYGKNCSSNYFQ